MKKYLITTIYATVSIMYFSLNLQAQSNFVLGNQVIKPSTDVWDFIRHGEITPSLYTGTINLSIPFYIYKDNDFEIPISFDYASNGCMPNAVPGILGVDWQLNAGGSIAVEIRGMEDYENVLFSINNYEVNVLNYYHLQQQNFNKYVNHLLIDGRFRTTNQGNQWGFVPSFPRPSIYYCPEKTFANNVDCHTVYDAEPDIYHFNFMGYSGTFYADYDGTIRVYNTNSNNKDFKVELVPGISKLGQIRITTGDGFQYVFTTREETMLVGTTNAEDAHSYKLNTIIAPNGRQVSFTYKPITITTCNPGYTGRSGTYFTSKLPQAPGTSTNLSSSMISRTLNFGYTVVSITVSGGTKILFDYETFPSVGSEEQLSKIRVLNANSETVKECTFTYKQNPSGKQITYLDTVNIAGYGKYYFDYHNWAVTFPTNAVNEDVSYALDHWGYYNGNNTNTLSILTVSSVDDNNVETITSTARNANAYYGQCGMLSKITYPTGGFSTFEYEAHDYSKAIKRLTQNDFIPHLVNETGTCGGLRIKSIKNYNSIASIASSKTFEYSNGAYSSGILLNYPRYKIKYTAVYDDYGYNYIKEQNMIFTSSNMLTYGTTHIEYSKVKEIRSDGSQIEYNYTNSTMPSYMDANYMPNLNCEGYCTGEWQFYTGNIFNPNEKIRLYNLIDPGKSLQAERGKLYRKDIFNADNVPKLLYSEIKTDDTAAFLATDILPAMFIKDVALVAVNIDNYKSLSESSIQYLDNIAVEEKSVNTYNAHGQVSSISTTDSKGDIVKKEFEYVSDLTNPAGVHENMLDNNIFNYPLSEKIYLYKGGIPKLTEGIKYTYVHPALNNNKLVRISQIEIYDTDNSAWTVEKQYQYDSYGNLIEETDKNGVKTSYVWGYGGLHLAGICENMPLAEVLSVLPQISNSPLSSSLSNLAYSALKNINPAASIIKFEHKPLIGLTKITESSGKETVLDYNTTGKLKSITDDLDKLRNTYYYSPDNKE